MKFIVDAQLPKRLSNFFNEIGYNSVHTLELPNKNFTKDSYICDFADEENRIVVTKDVDFLETYFVKKQPQKLILVKTGNINNNDLISLFANNLPVLINLLKSNSFIEINNDEIIAHK
jgi:predicted nuclease of predicted toxin-antitoxin system